MEFPDIINTAIGASIPLIIFYLGYLIKRRQDKIEGKHRNRIQFELEAKYFGPQKGYYIVEVAIILQNKGLVRKVIDVLPLKIMGIKLDANIALHKPKKQEQGFDREDQEKDIDQIANFPITFVDKNIFKNKGSFFVEPGVIQQITYVARIPDDIRFLLVRSKFKYHKNSEHSVQKVFEIK